MDSRGTPTLEALKALGHSKGTKALGHSGTQDTWALGISGTLVLEHLKSTWELGHSGSGTWELETLEALYLADSHMLHYEQVFGNVFETRESKCCGVLMKHRRKVKGEELITLQMAQQLKTKNINVVPRQLFCRTCKAKYLIETET